MPPSRNEDGSMKLAFANLRIKDKTFLLFEGKKGTSTDRIAEVCDVFVDSLMALDSRGDSTSRAIGDVFYRLSDDLMPDGIDYLTEHLPSYIDTTLYAHIDTLLTSTHMARQMRQNKEDMEGEFGSAYPELIQSDPIGLRSVLAAQMQPLLAGGTGGYKTIDGHFFVADSTVCVAFITPRFSATNTGQGSVLFQHLNTLIEQFATSHPDIRICYHGTPASGFYNATQIKQDLVYTVGGSLLLVMVFLLLCFRRRNTLPLLLLPVVFGTLFGLTMMYFIKGQFSLIALGIGAIILGVALSYVLHILTHHRYVSDPEQLLRDQVRPVCLGCLTTIGSFTGLIFVNTALLQDFGLFATFAILGTTIFCLVFLPQLLGKGVEESRPNMAFRLIDRINAYPFHSKKPLLAVILLVTVVCIGAYVVRGTQFDANMHNLGYEEENTTYSENLLRQKTFTGDKEKYFAASGKTMEEAIAHFGVLEHKLDSLKRIGLVKSYTPTDQIFVPLLIQRQRIAAWKNYWTEARLQKVHALINQTAPAAGLNPEGFEPFFELARADSEPNTL